MTSSMSMLHICIFSWYQVLKTHLHTLTTLLLESPFFFPQFYEWPRSTKVFVQAAEQTWYQRIVLLSRVQSVPLIWKFLKHATWFKGDWKSQNRKGQGSGKRAWFWSWPSEVNGFVQTHLGSSGLTWRGTETDAIMLAAQDAQNSTGDGYVTSGLGPR